MHLDLFSPGRDYFLGDAAKFDALSEDGIFQLKSMGPLDYSTVTSASLSVLHQSPSMIAQIGDAVSFASFLSFKAYGTSNKLASNNPDQPDTFTPTGVLQLNAALYEEELTHDTVTGDIDVYDFDAVSGQSLTIHIRMDSLPSFDYRLLDANGNVLLSGSKQGSSFELFTLDFDVTQSGQFFFEMERPNHSSSTGTYQIALREDIHSADQSTVGVIDFNVGQITGTTSSDSDHDWFAFTVDAGTQVFFENTSGSSAGTTFNVAFKVYDSNGNEVAPDNPDNLFDTFSATLAEGGTYFLDILGQAPFVYQVSAQAIQGDVPGDASTTATIALNGAVVTSSFGGNGESDWFAFDVTAGELVEFSADANEAVIEVVNESGDLIASYSGATNYLLHEFAESGTYYVSVTSFGNDQFAYELRGRSVTDDFGNVPADAGSIGFDGANVSGALDFIGDEDWLSFSATAGQVLYFNSIPGSPDFLHQANIIDAQGNVLVASSSRGDSGRTHVTFEVQDDGTYYIQLIELASDAVGSYSISGHVLVDKEGETTETAASISTNLFPELGTLEVLSDVDLFEFEHDGQGALLYSITTNGLNFDDLAGFIQVNLDVVDGNGTVISNDGLLVAEAGTYYLRVSQDSGFSTGDVINYEVSLSSVEDDFAGDATTSGVITPGGAAALGTLDFSGDVDWFALSAAAGDNIYLLLQTENRSFENVQMQIFNPDGTTDGELFSFSAYASEFLLSAQQSGTYYIAVTSNQASNGDDTGAYSLGATTLDGADPSGQSIDTALPLEIGSRIAAEITFGSSAENEDRDYFSFDVIAGQNLQLDMMSLGLEAPVFWLVDSAGEQITSVFQGSATLTFNETGTYFIVATSALFDDLGAYSIGITDLNAEIPVASRGADSIQGTSLNDTLDGLAGNDEIFGLAGNDSITGGLGNDRIDGGEGIDTIVYAEGSAEEFNIVELSDGRFRVESAQYGIDIVSNVEFISIAGQQAVLRGDPVNLTEFSDDYTGTNGSNVVNGLAGDDTIIGRGGNDRLFGDAGNDSLDGGVGDDFLFGGLGNDLAYGGDGLDRFFGGDGNDTGFGGAGNDQLRGEAGDDTLNGDAGNDSIFGGTGADQISGGLGNDRIFAELGNDTVDAGDGDDVALGQEGDDMLSGGAGRDLIWGGADNDTINGDAGDDILRGNDGDDTLNGGLGADNIQGGAGINTLNGGEGNDKLIGVGSHDILNGGDGDDFLLSGDGTSTMSGGAGRDFMIGGAGADNMDGGIGNDSLFGNEGDDIMTGGEGFNRLFGGDGEDDLTGGSFIDWLFGGTGNDILRGGGQADELYGEGGDDQMFGEDGNDLIRGNDGADTLDGGAGNDNINGNAGADTLIGGAGADILFGGSGIDTFVFNAGDALTGAVDRILDLEAGELIQLGGHSFLGEGAFTGGGSFEVRYSSDGTNTRLELDRDGNGAADELIIISGDFDFTSDGTELTAAAAGAESDDGMWG